jgi:adenylate kinase family enzyme
LDIDVISNTQLLKTESFSVFEPPSRIVIVGTTCSGKTTLARKLASLLSVDHIELDQLHWRENWTEAPLQEFRLSVDAATDRSSWIVDGNYSVVRDIVWRKATHIIWLEYPFFTVFGRCFSRTVMRSYTREKLFSNNRETLAKSFLSTDSIILWMLKTYHRRKKEYPKLFQEPNHRHLRIIRIRCAEDEQKLLSLIPR